MNADSGHSVGNFFVHKSRNAKIIYNKNIDDTFLGVWYIGYWLYAPLENNNYLSCAPGSWEHRL